MIFALAGNQNSGKTTLFNQLTGSNQHVGNFPGVTVEKKEGVIRKHLDAKVVDLPGIYSLSPYTSEEIVTRDYLLSGHIDGIINIVDATNIERNLYLSMQLIELGLPMVIALNMMDEVRSNGTSIDMKALSEEFGVRIVPIAAAKNEGVDELIEAAISAVQRRRQPKRLDFCTGAVHRAIHSIAHMIEDHALRAGVPMRFAATKLLEGDEPMLERLQLSENEQEMLCHTVSEMEQELSTDRAAAMADMRYTFIERICAGTVVKTGASKEHERSVRIDRILTHRSLGLPVFLLIMGLVFWLTVGVLGAALSTVLEVGVAGVSGWVEQGLIEFGTNPVLRSLIFDGI
ncbi:MAG: ferrous iron transporter B, partial [Pygmaiobacter sp.]